jgi:hypothetical protein
MEVTPDDQSLFPLPSNGYRPGGRTMLARIRGEFHAEKLPDGQVEAWLGEKRRPTLWPEGYFVRFGLRAELIGPNGKVVGREGDMLSWAGGHRSTGVWLQAGPGQPSPTKAD